MEQSSKTVAVFGVFDTIHEGHRYFLKRAKRLGDRLIVILASDSNVLKLKGRAARNSFEKRLRALRKEMIADVVLAGDSETNVWRSLERSGARLVALGYDQKNLGSSLRAHVKNNGLPIEIVTLKPCKGDSLHSSLLSSHRG